MKTPMHCCHRDPRITCGSHLRSALRSPRRYVRTLTRSLRLSSHGLRGRLLGLSWFLEAVVVQRRCERRGIRHVHVHLDGTAPAVGLLVTHLGNGGAQTGPWSFSMTVHGSKEFFDVARQRLARKVRAARFVVCVSDFTRSQLMALVDNTHWPRLHVVHCGIDPEHFAPPEQRPNHDGLIRILTVGRLDNMKGVAILIEAVGGAAAAWGAGGADRRGRRPSARPSPTPCCARFHRSADHVGRHGGAGRDPRPVPRRTRLLPTQLRRGHPGRAHGGDVERASGRRQPHHRHPGAGGR